MFAASLPNYNEHQLYGRLLLVTKTRDIEPDTVLSILHNRHTADMDTLSTKNSVTSAVSPFLDIKQMQSVRAKVEMHSL